MPNHHQRLQSVPSSDRAHALWLTDELLFNYQRCNRRAFLDLYGDLSQRDPPSDYLRKLRQDSLQHQRSIVGDDPVHAPTYPREDWLTGAAKTLELMQQGADRIAQGVLVVERENGLRLVSRPSLLIKQPGFSYFGDWLYETVDIKLGKRPKLDYQMIAAYHAYVLAEVQGAWAETSWLMLRQRGAYAVDLVEMLPRMQDILENCMQMLIEQQEPDVFIAHNRCDLCHWASFCYDIARTDQHLSLLPGVTPNRYTQLKALKLTTLDALAIAPAKRLEPLPGFGFQVASKLVKQAQATLQNKALALPQRLDISAPLLTTAELPTDTVELYFDIEAAPDQNLVYLHGVLVVDRLAQTEAFHALLAEHQDDESLVWEQLLELLWRYPSAPIFHFCPYEVQTVRRLAVEYNTPEHLITPLVERFVDLHERVTRVATMPVESYALKPIARWIGFDWRDADANGAQSIYWYDQWLATGDRRFLESILRYNEDDCRATYHVKDWLVDFTQGNGFR
ncbi:TM0106 family RecB-like putative nuclease [Oculatella sp. LEGE 06141]|uniref:TM0106 family RecB-like putative nuclease n=1 Tax=Oculatella sp. LEGE 06141 TaxID=1828648 RepID=UPI001D142B02|nr:TM0106 family RecB-like putative nuclease [Oculatella sp. LEGE 06141]